MSLKIKVALSVACGVLAALFCVLYGKQIEANAEEARSELLERYGGEVITIVVAVDDLDAGEVIDASNVEEREWLVDLAPANPVVSLEEVIGLELASSVGAGVPLSEADFVEETEILPLPSGCVSFSIAVTDKLSLPSSAKMGSVLVAYEVISEKAVVISSEVHILSMSETASSLSGKGTITVAVPAADASAVFSAKDEGTLRLAFVAEDVDSLEFSDTDPEAPSEVLPVEEEAAETDELTEYTDMTEQDLNTKESEVLSDSVEAADEWTEEGA